MRAIRQAVRPIPPLPRLARVIAAAAALAGALLAATGAAAGPAEACAGLIGSNGAVNLGRTTTLAAYHDGVEHYVTAFQFLGGGGQFGSLIPLPGVPTQVERGGAWTLQRLVRETQPENRLAFRALASAPSAAGAEVLQQVRIDALDLTVLKGGAADVAAWAKAHGFRLSPDAPEVLDFYAQRSPIFLAAVFDGDAARQRGQRLGDGTPVHITIPTENPWVPLRILTLGKQPADRVEADVFLLTDRMPTLLPGPREGLTLAHSGPATAALLNDLRADAGMQWVPRSAWLTKLRVDGTAGDLRYDLAVDAAGRAAPSRAMRVAAGLEAPAAAPFLPAPPAPLPTPVAWPAAALLLLAGAAVLVAVLVAEPAAAGLRQVVARVRAGMR
jgi:hypothetical protein